ncbi:RnfABCDGE type electron transport complex subunit B [uncultured Mailhella sp.]|uniref:RnfABCDGE type electron transport complex subunit B n=1 Tax=uncultured Mailhella sp. TaxID=1981031 RepID=UPI00261B3742|nr:Fe-S cluster domain-containing protein [uncultured Mailhella sp.]
MVLSSILTLAGLGFLAAALLAVASRVFAVHEDPLVARVSETLPGANCGGCGYAGCEGYAQAVVHNPAIPPNLCVVGGAKTASALGALTGKLTSEMEPLTAYRRCDKNAGQVARRFDYKGIPSCAAAAALHQGSDQCGFSCLGFGDCVKECITESLHIENGAAVVNETTCIGCGKCVKVCPRDVLQLIPKRARVAITCSTKDKLKAVTDVCKVGCIHCEKCVKVCPAQAIVMENGRIQIDQKRCLDYGDSCALACARACPRKILRLHGGAVLPPEPKKAQPAPSARSS